MALPAPGAAHAVSGRRNNACCVHRPMRATGGSCRSRAVRLQCRHCCYGWFSPAAPTSRVQSPCPWPIPLVDILGRCRWAATSRNEPLIRAILVRAPHVPGGSNRRRSFRCKFNRPGRGRQFYMNLAASVGDDRDDPKSRGSVVGGEGTSKPIRLAIGGGVDPSGRRLQPGHSAKRDG